MPGRGTDDLAPPEPRGPIADDSALSPVFRGDIRHHDSQRVAERRAYPGACRGFGHALELASADTGRRTAVGLAFRRYAMGSTDNF